jgi:hypothetical protein
VAGAYGIGAGGLPGVFGGAGETAALPRAYTTGTLPRAVVIGPDARVALLRAGYDEIVGTDWESSLKP